MEGFLMFEEEEGGEKNIRSGIFFPFRLFLLICSLFSFPS